jgi:hypothetical protein
VTGSVSKDMAMDREQSIETLRELANAQEQLGLGGNTTKMSITGAAAASSLWPPLKLLDYALDKVDECNVRDDKIDTCFIALAICSAIPSKVRETTPRVWCKALLTDTELLRNLMPLHDSTAGSSDGDTMEVAFHESIFGALLGKCNQVEKWKNNAFGMCFDTAIERLVLECLDGRAERPLLQAFLRHALLRAAC